MMRLNFGEHFTKLLSKSKNYAEKRNGISFWAFLLSIFIYTSIFYVFNLSPLALFNTTKFWFFISNTLILIIAADFGAFFSSRKQDYYEYVKNTQVRTHNYIPPSFEFQYHKMVQERTKDMVQKQKHIVHDQHPQEKIKDIIIVHQKADESRQKELEIIVKEEPGNPNENPEDKKLLEEAISKTPKVDDERVLEQKKNESKCMRSKSEKIILVAEDEKKIQRSQSERYDYGKPEKKDEENDFSTMSDEELNRRVEEFIRNFNRQIRLQAIRNRQNLHAHEV